MSAGAPHAVLQMASLGRIAEDGPLVIERASGMTLTAGDGRTYIDALSGLYNVNVGWGRDELADVAAATMRRLGYASNFFGRTTQEALDLSETLARITPDGIDRFFFDWRGGRIPSDDVYQADAFGDLRTRLEGRRRALIHPYWEDEQPCSMLIEEVESIWSAIADHDDWRPFEFKIEAIRRLGDAMASDAVA